MRTDSVAFLVIGFAAGFGLLYFWTIQREPEIVSATPLPFVPPQAAPQTAAAAPPVNMALVQSLQDRLKANPSDFDALVGLGNINFDQRNFAEATEFYKKALTIRPDDIDVRTDLGTMLFYQNRYDEAITELNRTLSVNPAHGQALFNLGVVLLHGKNNPQAALQVWEKLVATNPSFPQIEVVKEQIRALKESQTK